MNVAPPACGEVTGDLTRCGGFADVGGGPAGAFGGAGGTGLAPVEEEVGLERLVIGVRTLAGVGSIGGSFQFSVVRFGGGGRSAKRETRGFAGCNPGLKGVTAGGA